jgi:uncharacterized protein YdeI (YjbR/CyaY-like superfamily)
MVRAAEKSEPILTFKSAAKFEAYMSAEPRTSAGCWLKLSKAGASQPTITKQQAVEAALCCGWIDGQLAPLDSAYYLVRMTPRRRGSRWSRKNRDAADQLLAQGRIRPAGVAEIEAAKADGRWEGAYVSQAKAELPADLVAALTRNKPAAAFFEELDRANRYAIIYRVNDAKRPETRADRIAKFVAMLARGETLHPRKAGASAAIAKKRKRG